MADNKSLFKSVNDIIGNLYRKTYYTSNRNKKVLDDLNKNINTSINNIIDNNMNMSGTNISKLISRATFKDAETKQKHIKDLEDVFSDKAMMDNIMSVYMDNKYIRDLDLEIDTICKYMPKLQDALDAKRDAIFSADSFSKEYLNVQDIHNIEENESFLSNFEEIKRIYNLYEIIERFYENTSKYGEQFIYIVPYNKAFNKLLNANNNSSTIRVNESSFNSNETNFDISSMEELNEFKDYKLEVEINKSNIITSIVNEAKNDLNKKIIDPDKLSFDTIGTDGLIDNKKSNNISTNVTGCIVRSLKRENVIPVYIDDICFGYYYVESEVSNPFEYVESLHDPISSLKGAVNKLKEDEMKKDTMLKSLSSRLSKCIDATFINKNQDLTKEIYLILKHNDLYNNNGTNKIRISYIPPEDMIHMYFKLDERTHRGVSDLSRSIFPAKLYSCLYITNTIGILTRSQDKRAYFVKQYVDTNISALLLNTINQIKKSNFGMREINNINNMFNITGRFNDYVIPVSQSGERPIDFEIIQGQNIDTKNDLMEALESMAINSTGTPIEIIDAGKSIDFSRQITVINGKFARHISKRQATLQQHISKLVTTIYNYHFGKNENINIILPPPSYLTINSTMELFRTASDLVESLVLLEVSDTERDEPWVPQFKRNLMRHHLSTYINWDNIERLKELSKIQVSEKNIGNEEE